ncbi:MAG: Tol-Pal system protein TolB [Betaproteobacteria bacterium]|nr:Tol-Pal system protein TolB [Betaproteobacteria bacterium]MDE2055958.1 Tol-Pal system protein TolB [Betaproteobacteria bacterium]
MKNKLLRFVLIVLAFCVSEAHAELALDITTEGAQQYPIAVLNFVDEQNLGKSLTDVVRADLKRSGIFSVIDATEVKPIAPDSPNIAWADWKSRNAQYLVDGSVTATGNGQFQVSFRLWDVNGQVSRKALSFTGTPNQYRALAHHIADVIYEDVTGIRGIFSTKIAYVEQQGELRALKIADSDGYNEITILSAKAPIISPRWSPDGKKIAYVTFELGRPMVVIQTLATGKRVIVAKYRGNNSAPAWSPDGKYLAVVLSKEGIAQMYLIPSDGRGYPKRITYSESIDTEPTFSPDGQSIYFTSDRGGNAQIYRIPINGGDATRLTYGSTYCVSPRLSPDGRKMVYIERDQGSFHVMQMDLGTNTSQIMTDTDLDESPTFAPNGQYILYATRIHERGELAIVSSDGRSRQSLATTKGDVYEPVWGPFE